MTASSSPQPDLIGAVLNRKYPLKRLIGAGGMGAVYESQNPEDGRSCAVKVLALDYLHDADIKARFVEEGRMCQRLIHPNIVRVFEVNEAEDGTPYIVMELLDGVPLSAYTRSNVRVPIGQASTILQGILAGLGAAHAQGIVHRDLKPENVVLAREPNGSFGAKILDFGIAKVMDVAGGMGSKTKTGIMLGTPAYMSPEQIKNSKDVDARSDLWSAGVLLYEMLAGRVAFPAPTEYARLAAVLNTNPPPLETVDPQLARLSAFVQLSMQKDRAQRFQTALEMARALAASASIEPAQPLSRLPDVPSMFAPQMAASPIAQSGPTVAQQSIHPISQPIPAPPTEKGPGGTLASPAGGPRVSEAPPQVKMVTSASGGTLPSEHLPMLSAHGTKKGIAAWIVAILVFVALVAGFLLGIVTARLF